MLLVRSGAVHQDVSERSLVFNDQLGLACRVWAVDELEEVAHTLLQLVDVRHHLRVVSLRPVGLVRQRRVRLREEEGILRVVMRVRVSIPREEHVHVGLVELHNDIEQRLVVLDCVDQVKPGLNGLVALLFDPVNVRARLVIQARAAAVVLQHLDHLVLDVELRLVPRTSPRRLVLGNVVVVGLVPAAARILIKVIARVHALVEAGAHVRREGGRHHLRGNAARLLRHRFHAVPVVHHEPHALRFCHGLRSVSVSDRRIPLRVRWETIQAPNSPSHACVEGVLVRACDRARVRACVRTCIDNLQLLQHGRIATSLGS